jgi:hypothetical protein
VKGGGGSERWGDTLVMFIARYLVGVRKRRKARPRWEKTEREGDVVDDDDDDDDDDDVVDDGSDVVAGAVTWIYNEFSCLARVRIRKAKVPGSKGLGDGGRQGEEGGEERWW